jgi:hypothetical protein
MGKALSKSQIAATVAEKVGITKKQAVECLETLVELAYKAGAMKLDIERCHDDQGIPAAYGSVNVAVCKLIHGQRQMALPGSRTNPDLVAARFLLKPGRKYEQAVKAFEP